MHFFSLFYFQSVFSYLPYIQLCPISQNFAGFTSFNYHSQNHQYVLNLSQQFLLLIFSKSQMQLSSNTILFTLSLLLFSTLVHAINLNPQIFPAQSFCINQILESGQRYQFSVFSEAGIKFRATVGCSLHRKFITLFNQSSSVSSDKKRSVLRTNKISAAEGTYTFCIHNNDDVSRIYNATITTGQRMLQLSELPDSQDSNKIDQQIEWLENTMSELQSRLFSMEAVRSSNEEIHGVIGTKMIIFAVIGMVLIGVVNCVFYRGLRKQFRNRKLI